MQPSKECTPLYRPVKTSYINSETSQIEGVQYSEVQQLQ